MTAEAAGDPTGTIRIVLLAGPGESTDIVANALATSGDDLVVVVEEPASRVTMARRRARRLGWPIAVGQVLFVVSVLPVLRRRSAARHAAILKEFSLDATPVAPTHRVASVNDDQVIALLDSIRPDLVVVNGTRIIAARILDAVNCPIINVHTGITPRYRGVHGGYWALADAHPEWVGTTVHLVDPGIDTGGILGQSVFAVTSEDSFATYPTLHVAAGLPLLGAQIDRVRRGDTLQPGQDPLAPGSHLYFHPTAWGYLWSRWRRGVR